MNLLMLGTTLTSTVKGFNMQNKGLEVDRWSIS